MKIASGIVEYSGTTDAAGKYTFPVYQDNLEYTMTVTKDGYFEKTETVAFNGESIVKDVALESAEGFKILSFNIPETGEVNTAYTATVACSMELPKRQAHTPPICLSMMESWQGQRLWQLTKTPNRNSRSHICLARQA